MTRRALPAIAVGAAIIAVGLASLAAWRQLGGPTAASAEHPELWARSWTEARGCVLGTPPASGVPNEALAAADLTAPARTCGRQLVALARAAGPDEADLHAAIGAVADAQVAHQRRLLSGKLDDRDPLPDAIDALELAAGRYHPKAHGPAPASPALMSLSTRPILLDGDPATINMNLRGLYARRSTNEQLYEIRWDKGEPAPLPYPADGSDATWAPSGMWQVWTDEFGNAIKLMSATDQAEEITLAATSKPGVRLIAALGEGDNRLIVYHDYDHSYVARSTDGAHHWTQKKLADEMIASWSVSADGTAIDLAWTNALGTRWQRLVPEQHARGDLPRPEVIAPGRIYADCPTGAMWLVLADGDEFVLRRPEHPGEIARFKHEPVLEGCSAERAVVDVDERTWVCDRQSCRMLPDLHLAARAAWTGVIGDETVRLAIQDDVVAVWRGDAPPVFARLPHGGNVVKIVDGGAGAAIAVIEHDEHLEYVELPR